MKSLIIKDKKRRMFLQKIYSFQRILKFLIKNKMLPEKERILMTFLLLLLKKKIYKTQIRNRCIYTARARAIFLTYRISRLVFNQLITTGILPGLRTACW